MRPYVWLNGATDPCLTDPESPGFNDPHWSIPSAPVPFDGYVDLPEASNDLIDSLMVLPKHVCEQHFGLNDVVIEEYGEIPGLCRHGQRWYRLCISTHQHPQRAWCHVMVDENEQIIGLRLEPA